jgi:hypothetical protein
MLKIDREIEPTAQRSRDVQATSTKAHAIGDITLSEIMVEKLVGGDRAKSDAFKAVLHGLADKIWAEAASIPVVREIDAPPVLCPRANSPVRFLPLEAQGTSPIAREPGSIWDLDTPWTFVDFAVFEGADFAYAVCRSLLYRIPSKRQIQLAASIEGRLFLLLEAHRKSHRIPEVRRLAGLYGSKMLYWAFRACRKMKLAPLAAMLRAAIHSCARNLHRSKQDMIVQRRLLLRILNGLSEKNRQPGNG